MPARRGSYRVVETLPSVAEERNALLITILIILLIIAVALFIWRNLAGRRV